MVGSEQAGQVASAMNKKGDGVPAESWLVKTLAQEDTSQPRRDVIRTPILLLMSFEPVSAPSMAIPDAPTRAAHDRGGFRSSHAIETEEQVGSPTQWSASLQFLVDLWPHRGLPPTPVTAVSWSQGI